jgi:hypothetical protein
MSGSELSVRSVSDVTVVAATVVAEVSELADVSIVVSETVVVSEDPSVPGEAVSEGMALQALINKPDMIIRVITDLSFK